MNKATDLAAQRRIMKAMDEDRVLCKTCDVRFFDYYFALVESLEAGAPLRIEKCKAQNACIAEEAMQRLRGGTAPGSAARSAVPPQLTPRSSEAQPSADQAAADLAAVRRIAKAVDEDRVLCETCDVGYFEFFEAAIASEVAGVSFQIETCRHPKACTATRTAQAIRDGIVSTKPGEAVRRARKNRPTEH